MMMCGRALLLTIRKHVTACGAPSMPSNGAEIEATQPKRSLWYARILYMMACEQRYKQWDYEILNFYLKPCIEAYEQATASSEQPNEKEVDAARCMYEQYSYDLSNMASTAECIEQAYSLIEGLSEFSDFAFHDSKVVSFTHNETDAQMVLQYDNIELTLIFDEISEIKVNAVDPFVTYIMDCYCYPAFHLQDRLIFDIGFYQIRCKSIRAIRPQTA